MLSRFVLRPSNLRLISLVSSKSQPQSFSSYIRSLSTSSGGDENGNGYQRSNDPWRFSRENDTKLDSIFAEESGSHPGVSGSDSLAEGNDWMRAKNDGEENMFEGMEKEEAGTKDGYEWFTAEDNTSWNLTDDSKDSVFDVEEVRGVESREVSTEVDDSEQRKLIEKEEKELSAILKGSDRAFGDLIERSGITDDMLDSLIALKDFQGVQGLPPLTEIENMRYEKSSQKSSRADIELQKQEEMARSRVRQVDEKGRAYGTGRRKCSIARVWIQPGDGQFLINEKAFDVYFPTLDHRAALLRPFSETKTLGLWDVKCTVKGGGFTGQVGAIQLGISRALQNWEPDLRPPLRSAGFLTRDSRVVERKKPGKAKARKSFQWVKR